MFIVTTTQFERKMMPRLTGNPPWPVGPSPRAPTRPLDPVCWSKSPSWSGAHVDIIFRYESLCKIGTRSNNLMHSKNCVYLGARKAKPYSCIDVYEIFIQRRKTTRIPHVASTLSSSHH